MRSIASLGVVSGFRLDLWDSCNRVSGVSLFARSEGRSSTVGLFHYMVVICAEAGAYFFVWSPSLYV